MTLGGARRGYAKFLPYDAEVEYIESSGTQWIDTGVSGFINARARFAILSSGGRACVLVGRVNDTGYERAYTIFTFGTKFYRVASLSWTAYANSPTVPVGQMIDVEAVTDATTLSLTALDVAMSGNRHESKLTHTLFADVYNRDTAPVIYEGGSSRLASLQISDTSNNLLRDFIAVRVGSVGYMYDKVSKLLFGNQGEGAFVVGPDKS